MDKIERIERVLTEGKRELVDDLRKALFRYQHRLMAEVNWTKEMLDKTDEGSAAESLHTRAKKKTEYDFAPAILNIVKDASEPVPAQQIIDILIPVAMEEGGQYSKELARGNIARSLAGLCNRTFKDNKVPPGIIAVELTKGRYKIVRYKPKSKNTTVYPLNLIWHIDRFREQETAYPGA